jgi:hypothetical protein
MDYKSIIEQERSKFVDGKIPATHIMYHQYMATLDWSGDLTEEQTLYACRKMAEMFAANAERILTPVKTTAEILESDIDKISAIADSMRRGDKWPSVRAVVQKYKDDGGTLRFWAVFQNLKKLGKTNPQPVGLQRSRDTRSKNVANDRTSMDLHDHIDEIQHIHDVVQKVEQWKTEKSKISLNKKRYSSLSKIEQQKIKANVWDVARRICMNMADVRDWRGLLYEYGHTGHDLRRYFHMNGIMTKAQYDSIVYERKWPKSSTQYSLPLPNQQAARPQ